MIHSSIASPLRLSWTAAAMVGATECSSVWKNTWFGIKRPLVQIRSLRFFHQTGWINLLESPVKNFSRDIRPLAVRSSSRQFWKFPRSIIMGLYLNGNKAIKVVLQGDIDNNPDGAHIGGTISCERLLIHTWDGWKMVNDLAIVPKKEKIFSTG